MAMYRQAVVQDSSSISSINSNAVYWGMQDEDPAALRSAEALVIGGCPPAVPHAAVLLQVEAAAAEVLECSEAWRKGSAASKPAGSILRLLAALDDLPPAAALNQAHASEGDLPLQQPLLLSAGADTRPTTGVLRWSGLYPKAPEEGGRFDLCQQISDILCQA